MTLRMGLPSDAQGLKVLGTDGVWTPAIGTQQVENLAINPSFESTTGNIEVRRNYTVNPSFRAGITEWNAGQGVSAYANGRLEVTMNDAWGFGPHQTTAIVASSSQIWSARRTIGVPVGQPAQTLDLGIAYYLSTGSSGVLKRSDTVTIQPGQTVTLTVNGATMPTSTTGTRSVIYPRPGAGVAGVIFVTEDLMELSMVASSHFDGSTAASGDFSYAWLGTVNASASVRLGTAITGITGQGASAIQSSEWSASGSKSLRIISNATSTGVSWAFITTTLFSLLKPGKTYTVLAKARLTAPLSASSQRSILMSQNGTGNPTVQQSAQIPNAPGVYDVKTTFITNKDATAGSIRLYHGGFSGEPDIFWDDILIIEGIYTGSYFDGNTPPDSDYIYRWSGTPHNSISIGI